MFGIIKKSKRSKARIGRLKLLRGEVQTPCFMPIATRGAVKNLAPEELKKLGAEIILGNTYHLWQKPGPTIIKKAGGLHKFINWRGPILTDSGGYQVFSLAKHRKISDQGVKFSSEIDGRELFLTPEKSIEIQLDLGSDIIMILDECPPWPCSHEYAQKSLDLTLSWTKRCKDHFNRKIRNPKPKIRSKSQIPNTAHQTPQKPLLFGIVQGSTFKDLREKSAKELVKIGFDGYAIGGVSVGEPLKEKIKVLKWTVPLLPNDKPRYLMGLGRPEEIVAAASLGVDMFDCVIPTREARHGRIYKFKNQNSKIKMTNQNSKFYETLQITNAKFQKDFRPLDKNCGCYTCRNFSRAYLNHLFKIQEPLALRLATIHNLKFYLELMKGIRENMK